jgi:hypothetical protein
MASQIRSRTRLRRCQWRKFHPSWFVAADFDGSLTIPQARNNAHVRSHSGLIYTTASHTEQEHRFRIVFPLAELITDGRHWANANLDLAHKLGSDPTIGDPARCFFGSVGAAVWWNDQIMPREVWEDLAQYGSELRSAPTLGRITGNGTALPTRIPVASLYYGKGPVGGLTHHPFRSA